MMSTPPRSPSTRYTRISVNPAKADLDRSAFLLVYFLELMCYYNLASQKQENKRTYNDNSQNGYHKDYKRGSEWTLFSRAFYDGGYKQTDIRLNREAAIGFDLLPVGFMFFRILESIFRGCILPAKEDDSLGYKRGDKKDRELFYQYLYYTGKLILVNRVV